MTMSRHVRASGLPLDKVVVIGSGLLDQLGLRVSDDIDLAVAPELFAALKQSGEYVVSTKRGEEYLERGRYEIWQDWGADAPFERLWHEGQTLDGVRFVSTEFLVAWKRVRALEKDIRDIALLEAYDKHSQNDGESV